MHSLVIWLETYDILVCFFIKIIIVFISLLFFLALICNSAFLLLIEKIQEELLIKYLLHVFHFLIKGIYYSWRFQLPVLV